MRKGIVTTCSVLLLGAMSSQARAAEPTAEGGTEGKASGGVSLGTKDGAKADGDASGKSDAKGKKAKKPKDDKAKGEKDRGDVKWIKRWAPERNMAELGLYGGVLFPARRLELFEPDQTLPDQGFKEFKRVAPSIGLRLGYYPLRVFGVEGEAGVMPTRTNADDMRATLWGMRLQFVGQVPLWSVTPFVLVGGGMLNVASDRAAVGSDVDASIHFGGGVKVFINRYTMLRLDVRDHVTAGQGVDDGVIHSPEVLLGFSLTLGRKKLAPKPGDRDGDGILDPDDQCIDVPGVPEYQGCPIPDTDGDGILDPDDKCVDVPGVPEYDGCPIPDTDGDGILDPDDECVDVPGVPEYKGCPIPDTDGDGILDPSDKCIEEPETKNGYQDKDGCPDEVPQDLGKFTGVIEGIYFDVDKDSIKKKSAPKLQRALDVFKKYPDVKVEISGHTDSTGNREHNLELSQRRADAVKQWLVDRGVEESRITTRGSGPDEPVDTNDTKAGRAKNRRIEFKLK
ncbi:OmpA family protein [Paraliomyxa miuraensis]|uniref:OmpA family protein n=1 Tax=Paraliomyxa miuraensis TaxID=376150 RepID=UPI00225A95C6|nr:OmpA family protein [Paraliomyxa miuraensis]MCX4246536.1 OmpA family protein [Paraliomyxa miuraensis]